MMSPSGPTKTWKLWRHCCCRYGLYPLLVVPIVTLGCLLTIYSSVGCKFIEIDIGFAPTNEGWNVTAPYHFGLFYYHNASTEHDNLYQNSFHSGCTKYSDTFYDNFIGSDRTFKMTQIMTMIACVSSALAMVVSWLFVVTPLPVGIFWPGIFLPSVLVAFIAEGSKFLLFDTALCRNSLWYRTDIPIPEQAESCTMDETGWFACAATVLHFWGLMCVCFKAPERRVLSETYGSDDSGKPVQETTSDDNEDDSEDSHLERGNLMNLVDIIHVGMSKPRKANNINSNNNTFSSRKPVNLEPIVTTNSSGESSTTEKEASKSIENPEPRRNSALSPVDFIIDGFDVATDFSHINVCRTIGSSSETKALNDGSGSALKKATDLAEAIDKDICQENIEVIETPEFTKVPSIIMSPAMKHHHTEEDTQEALTSTPQEADIITSPALRQDP